MAFLICSLLFTAHSSLFFDNNQLQADNSTPVIDLFLELTLLQFNMKVSLKISLAFQYSLYCKDTVNT